VNTFNTTIVCHPTDAQLAPLSQGDTMNFFKTLPLLAGLLFGGVVIADTNTAHAQQIIRESREGGKRVHNRANVKKSSAKRTTKKKTTTVTTTSGNRVTRTVHTTRPSRTVHHRDVRHRTVYHRPVYTHSRTHYVHPRHHHSYRYVFWPRYQSYHTHHTDVVYVEVEREPELPELDCPVYTEAVVTDRETYCATDRGTRHGPFVRYHTNGEVAEEGLYDYGSKEGLWVQYHTNGSLKSEGSYHHGEREGEWVNFNSDGEEISRTIYR
jgi:hypothetical protein